MYLNRVRLKNIRCFGDLDIKFGPSGPDKSGWNVIVGGPGTGKTTLLQSIAATILGPSNATVMMERPSNLVRIGCEEGRTDVWIDGNGSDDWRDPKDVAGEVRLGVTWNRNEGARTHPPRGNHNFVTTQFWEGASFGAQPRGWCLAAYGPNRHAALPSSFAAQLMSAPPRRSGAVSLFRPDATMMAARTWVRDIGHGDLSDFPEYEVKLNLLGSLVSDGLLSDDESWVNVDLTNEGIVVQRPYGRIPLAFIGGAYEALALLVTDIIRQMAAFYGKEFMRGADWEQLAEQKVKVPHSGLVLIDEIENHLPPQIQMRIGRWMVEHFPNVQFIVTTHSPFICQTTDHGRLYYADTPGTVGQYTNTDLRGKNAGVSEQRSVDELLGIRITGGA